ncbi:MAG: hypothetical protein RIR16_228 [Actinomycetota bacterium]|jgi:hypothetical protein
MSEQLLSEDSSKPSYWDRIRAEISSLGGQNSLRNFAPSSLGQIDLERSHPGGFSQFVTGKQTLLSNLVRDPLAFSRSLSAARRIKNRADRLSQNYGIDSLALIGGLATFTDASVSEQIPILRWKLQLQRKGDDYEISLAAAPVVNPALTQKLDSLGIRLSEPELLARQLESSDLVPVTVLNYLANLTANLGNVEFRRILVISNFALEPILLEQQFAQNPNFVLDKSALSDGVFANSDSFDRYSTQQTVLSADLVQRSIIGKSLTGASFAVETLPGCGYLQTVLNLLAEQVRNGKRVLLLANREQTRAEIADRLAQTGLAGLAVRTDSAWLDLVAAISRNEKSKNIELSTVEVSLQRENIDRYDRALFQEDPRFGVSISTAMMKLASISSGPNPPRNTARISADRLQHRELLEAAMADLNQALELGEYRFGPQDSAWFGAQFESPVEVERVVQLVKRLSAEALPRLTVVMDEFTARSNFKPAESVAQWGEYLRLFIGIRETLDRFVADVFDRPLTELIAATAPRKGVPRAERPAISGGNRRRLKKLAREYLRPGMGVSDLHAALNEIDSQRMAWAQLCQSPIPPSVPLGIADAQVAYQAFLSDLEILQKHLDPEVERKELSQLTLPELARILESLAEDQSALDGFAERLLVQQRLKNAGLSSLSRELARLHVASSDEVAAEFELTWWQSVLEELIRDEGAGPIVDFDQREQAENELGLYYQRQLANSKNELLLAQAAEWQNSIAAHPDQAKSLKEVLRSGQATVAQIMQTTPNLAKVLAPAIISSGYYPKLSLCGDFDLVLALDAASTTTAEQYLGLSKAPQVIAFGDPAISAPLSFDVEVRVLDAEQSSFQTSLYAEVAAKFGSIAMVRSYRTAPQALGAMVNREFYEGRINFTATAEEFLGKKNFNLELVRDHNRAKSTIEGATESLDGELVRTVELIFHHAQWQPEKSLLVASASEVHAERLRSAVAEAIKTRSAHAEFFDAHGREKFEIVSLVELSHRIADRVIFSLGYGKTSHGAVLSNFGQLSSPEGPRRIANLLVSARKEITIVSCFEPDELPAGKISQGADLLIDLLKSAAGEPELVVPAEPDFLLNDLSLRLKKLGVRVATNYGNLPLVAAYGKQAAAIFADWNLVGSDSIEKFAIEPQFVTALGWKYLRVFSFELFSDPQNVANRIAESLGLSISKQPQALFSDADRAFEDTDVAWGDRSENNDQRLKRDKPPHWG